MGQAVCGLIDSRPEVALAVRHDLGGRLDYLLAGSDVVIDFTTSAASLALTQAAVERGRPALVIGTTGFDADADARIATAANTLAIVKSGNFSLGLNLMAALVRQAAARLAADEWDIEILEAHHRHKRDAPSGSALMLGDAAAGGRGTSASSSSNKGETSEARTLGSIGYASLRAGGLVGEHSVIFASDDEILTFTHSARDRRLFARGAVAAALWVRGRPPGLYAMSDVLGL
jgi:4-hydroxy-tetrahydrodipicolinate reductase